jgi:diguanylate cyclase (GGDEF)-like protein
MHGVTVRGFFFKCRAWRSALLASAAITAIGTLGLVLRDVACPQLAFLDPMALFAATTCDFATALVLFGMWRDVPARRATLVLGLSFAASAALGGLALAVMPAFPGEPAAWPRAGTWLQIGWSSIAAIGAAAYIVLRRDRDLCAPSLRFTVSAIGFAILLLGGTVIAAIVGDRLPIPTATSNANLVPLAVGAAAVAALAIVTLLTFRIREPGKIDAALGRSLAAMAIGMTFVLVSHGGDTVATYAARLSVALASVFVLVAAIRTLTGAHRRVRSVELALSQAQSESLKRAGRIRALLEMSNVAFDEQRFSNILEIATTALRPGRVILGLLSHLEGETIVIDATSWTLKEHAGEIAIRTYPGATFPFNRTLQSLLESDGRSQIWDDLASARGRGMFFEELSVHSLIGTPLAIGRSTYYLTFCSTETMMDEPFAEEDIAYVDVVASHVADRITQQQQFERIQFQIEHDALTGLQNRVQLRRTVRQELSAATPFGLAFVNLDGFRRLNEQYGHQTGDDILVEVAAGLAAVDHANLVARMSGDEFAVLLRGVKTVDSVAAALQPYAEVLSKPFRTGDRDGTQTMRVSASIGAARFPADGTSVEELMRRADAALKVAKGRGGAGAAIFDLSMQPLLEESCLRSVELSDEIVQNPLMQQPRL